MAVRDDSLQIVTPVDISSAAEGRRGAANPAALTVEQLARALGVPAETVRRHVQDGAPTGAGGTVNLIHYAAWLNQRLALAGAHAEGNTDGD